MTKIVFKKNKQIKKEDYLQDVDKTNKEQVALKKLELKFDKKTDVVPKKTNKLLCVIFTEDKRCYFLKRKYNALKNDEKTDFFRFKKGMYIITNSGVHITDNNIRVAFYLEGVSVPIKMGDIEREIKEVEYIDLDGTKKKSIVEMIKGLKFDSKLLDVFMSRRFAEIFTANRIKKLDAYLMIIGIIVLVVSSINVVVSFVFR